ETRGGVREKVRRKSIPSATSSSITRSSGRYVSVMASVSQLSSSESWCSVCLTYGRWACRIIDRNPFSMRLRLAWEKLDIGLAVDGGHLSSSLGFGPSKKNNPKSAGNDVSEPPPQPPRPI